MVNILAICLSSDAIPRMWVGEASCWWKSGLTGWIRSKWK